MLSIFRLYLDLNMDFALTESSRWACRTLAVWRLQLFDFGLLGVSRHSRWSWIPKALFEIDDKGADARTRQDEDDAEISVEPEVKSLQGKFGRRKSWSSVFFRALLSLPFFYLIEPLVHSREAIDSDYVGCGEFDQVIVSETTMLLLSGGVLLTLPAHVRWSTPISSISGPARYERRDHGKYRIQIS